MFFFKLYKMIFILLASCKIYCRIGNDFFRPSFKVSPFVLKVFNVHEYFKKARIDQAYDGLLIVGISLANGEHEGKIVLVQLFLGYRVFGFTCVNDIVQFFMPQGNSVILQISF